MNLLAEGVRSSILPCSYSILVLAGGLVVLRRRERTGVLWVFAAATVVSAWLRAAGISNALAGRATSLALVLGGLALALLIRHRLAGWVSAALVGLFAGATWIPCVGRELGTLLTDAPGHPLVSLVLMAVYLVGVMIPAVAVTAVLAYVPAVARFADGRWATMAARAILVAVAVLVVTDRYGAVLSTLARWSTF